MSLPSLRSKVLSKSSETSVYQHRCCHHKQTLKSDIHPSWNQEVCGYNSDSILALIIASADYYSTLDFPLSRIPERDPRRIRRALRRTSHGRTTSDYYYERQPLLLLIPTYQN